MQQLMRPADVHHITTAILLLTQHSEETAQCDQCNNPYRLPNTIMVIEFESKLSKVNPIVC